MSEYTFYLVPTDVGFSATPEQIRAGSELWGRLSPRLERVCVYNHPQIMLWNSSEIESVECSGCHARLQVSFDFATFSAAPHGDWWKRLILNMQCNEGPESYPMPCCGKIASNQEIFELCSPRPFFSRFACGAHEPNLDLFEPDQGPLKNDYLMKFEKLFGVRFEHLWLGG